MRSGFHPSGLELPPMDPRCVPTSSSNTCGESALRFKPPACCPSSTKRLHRTWFEASSNSRAGKEIVVKLVAGKRVPEIAREMYLSPSTIRNHLTAVFRRFGVHSQVELITLLKRPSGPID